MRQARATRGFRAIGRGAWLLAGLLLWAAVPPAPVEAGWALGMTGSPPPPPPDPPPCGQNTEQCCPTGSGPFHVDFWNGREYLTHTDLVLPGLVPITIRRSYDSLAQYDSALGYGWALGYFMRIYEFADGSVVLRRDCGVRRSFVPVAGAYQTPVGETGTLVKNPDGTWSYTEKSGEVKAFDSLGRLSALVSPQGPYLLFSYDERGKLPLIGLSPYAVDTTPKEIARQYRLLRIEEYATGGVATGRFVDFTYEESTGRLTSLTDSAGRTVSYTQDGLGNLTDVSLPEGGSLHYAYEDANDPHNATSLTDSGCTSCGGAPYSLVYDAGDRVVREEVGQNVMRVTYDQPYQRTIVDEDVFDDQGAPLYTATTTYEFNTLGNPTRITDALGHEKVYTYDGRMNVLREERWENVSGNLVLRYVEERTYDARGNLLTVTEAKDTPQERTRSYTYAANDRLLTVTVPSVVDPQQNRVTTYTYDPPGNVITETETGLLGDGSPYSYATTYTYDANGRRTSVDGPRTGVSDVTSYAYDTVGNLTSVTAPGSLTTTYASYTATGQPQAVTDPNGVATTYTYDSLGRVLTATVAGGTTTYAYTSTGKLASVTLPRGNGTTYTYDALDRLTSLQDTPGNSINYTYDSAGNRLREEVRAPGGAVQKTLSFQYDALKRLSRIVNPDSSFTEFGYDYAGNRTSLVDPRGNTTSFTYDPLGRLLAATQPGAAVTAYAYDAHDDVVSLTDPEAHTTTYTYGDRGRVYREVSPDAGTTTYAYDPAGNRTAKTDARGVTVSYQYDANNRLTLTNFPSDPDITNTYDTCTNGGGRLCQVQDQSGTASYTYSAKGELAQETRVVQGVSYPTGYAYDPNGNLTTLTYPSGRTVVYSYDLADRATSVTTTPAGGGPQTVATSVSYKPFGGGASLTYGNGLARTVAYDQQYRITSIDTTGVQSLGYAYDPSGNVASITDNLDPGRTKAYGYDALDRLTAATGPWGSLGWTYDRVGNRLTQTAPEGPSTYSYQTGTNRLDSVSGPQPLSFSYDANGNVTNENATVYVFNENNRLIHASAGGSSGDYVLNASEQRASKVVAGQTTVFTHDQHGQILAESDATGTTITEYVYLNGQPIAKGEGTALSFIHTDHLGTPQAMTDAAGSLVWQIEPRPFGDAATITGSATLNLRFPGQYFDQETGLHQNWWREYAPGLGRYISADPIGELQTAGLSYYRARYYAPEHARSISEDPIGLRGRGENFYAYVGGNPVIRTDPSGLQEAETCQAGCWDSICKWYRGCPDDPEPCGCYCVAFTGDAYKLCIEKCNACWGAYKSPKAACKCSCEAVKEGDEKKGCLKSCQFLPK